MKKFQEKNIWSNIVQSKPVLFLLFILIVGLAWSVYGLMERMKETAKNKEIEDIKISELRERRDKLTSDIASLKTEKGVEENIREKFGLSKDGESVIIIVEDKDQVSDIKKEKQENKLRFFFKNIFK
jgi:cell division protein FtsB